MMYDEVLYSPSRCKFSLWSLDADAVILRIYDNLILVAEDFMSRDENGLWFLCKNGNYKHLFYTFDVKFRGNFLGETPGISPKAVNCNGTKAAIINFADTNPKNWNNDSKPELKSFSDIIIYETHHRDFSIHPSSGVKNKGKFLQWTEENSICMSHLKELGITHLHLLPSFDFATIDESKPQIPQYNWGYDPLNYNVPEGSYSSDAENPLARIKEFKMMVQSLHKNGIRVIMDVVYNHSYYTETSYFQKIAPNYFYRLRADGSFANASWCDNEIASEKPFVRQFIIDSLCYWAKEYHVDGFRLDLMGIIDIETINLARKALDEIDKSIFVYGEGWYAEKPQLDENEIAIKRNIPKMPRVAAFSDEFRDGIRGDKGWNGMLNGGFVLGNGFAENIKLGLVGGVWHQQINNDKIYRGFQNWASQPNQFIAYTSCHDDFCMIDTLLQSAKPNSSLADIIRYQKFAHSIVLLSQGLPFLFAGEEIFRSKKMIRNTYNLSDNINAIDWNNKILYRDLFDYFKNFIALRKKYPHFHLGDAENIRKNISFKEFSSALSEKVIIYQIKNPNKNDNILVILNASDENLKIQFTKVKVLMNNFIFEDKEVENEIIVEKTSVALLLFEGDTSLNGAKWC